MTPKELRAKKEKDIDAFIDKWSTELAVLKIQASVGQCEKNSRISQIRRDIARAKTILQERKGNVVADS